MQEGEGAALQIVLSPAGSGWSHAGRTFIAKTKKTEANPETAKYSADAKELEQTENKIAKPGFNVAVRIVVSSTSQQMAKSHLSNIISAFSQFAGINSFKKNRQWVK